MNNKNNSPEAMKIAQLVEAENHDYDSIETCYRQKKEKLIQAMKQARDFRERIKLQNILLELEDAFLEYQESLNHRK